MEAPTIVPALHVLEYVGARFVARRVVVLPRRDELALQRGEEALHRGVVPAVTLAAHRAEHAVLRQPPAVLVRGELRPAVRVVHQAWRGAAARDGHVERGQRELVAAVLGHGPADRPRGA